jgi:hypothetical protein
VQGRVTGAGGAPAGYLDLGVERLLQGGRWTPIATTRAWSDGTFSFVAVAWAPQVMQYRLRSVAAGPYASTLSGTVVHEARHDPLDAAQLGRLVATARAGGLHVGVGMVDRVTGKTYDLGYGQSSFYTASVAKVMIAMEVLRGEQAAGHAVPSAAHADRLRSMIRYSNDAIAWSYWRSGGGAVMVSRVNRRCGTAIRVDSNTWSMSRPTPVQWAQVLDCLADHRALSPALSTWLIGQMRSVTPSQRWGVPAADPDPRRIEANKNGWWRWPCCNYWTVNSTALFGPGDRYAYAVFTEYGGSLPQSRGEDAAYRATKAMFPWGTVIY